MIWTQVVCDMTRCGNYLDDIPEGEPIIAHIKAYGWTTRNVGDGWARHVCPKCKDRPTEDLR